MRRFCILPLIGLPGAGKTSFVHGFRDFLLTGNLDQISVLHVCYDQLVPLERQAELTKVKRDTKLGVETTSGWKDVRRNILNAVAAILSVSADKDALSEREKDIFDTLKIQLPDIVDTVLVIIDDNNYYQSMRYEYYQLAKSNQAGFCQLLFPITLEDALAVNKTRSEESRLPEEVIVSMHDRFDAPDPLCNSWEQFSFSLPSNSPGCRNENPYSMCQTVVQLALTNPARPLTDTTAERDDSRAVCSASVTHQSDKILRKTVGLYMLRRDISGLSKDAREKSCRLNEMRLDVLEDLKTGIAKLPACITSAVENQEESGLVDLEAALNKLFHLKLDNKEQTNQ